jgi:hypothetical protein
MRCFLDLLFSPSSISSLLLGFRIVVRSWPGLEGLGVREMSLGLWKRWLRPLRRGGSGGFGCSDCCLEGEAAREDASEEATIALANESTATEELTDTAEVEVRRLFCNERAARKEG